MSQLRPFDGKRFISVFVATLALLCFVRALPSTDPPLRAGQHIMFMWNAPTELCDSRYDMPLDLSLFHFVSSTLKSATNQSIALFYTDRFGVFPYVDEDTGELFDEGLPQLVDLDEHRELAEDDVDFYINGSRPGLAVLDFEEWRPQWVRNWGSKDIYWQLSIEKVREKNLSMTEDEVEDRAKVVFEKVREKNLSMTEDEVEERAKVVFEKVREKNLSMTEDEVEDRAKVVFEKVREKNLSMTEDEVEDRAKVVFEKVREKNLSMTEDEVEDRAKVVFEKVREKNLSMTEDEVEDRAKVVFEKVREKNLSMTEDEVEDRAKVVFEKVREKNLSMTEDEVEDRAKVVFERGARKYFLKSIRIGKTLRPNRLWGFYLYPDCYNYDYHQDMEGFTGECPAIEQDRNDELLWLWKESTALYPSIYLELVLRNTTQARMYVRHRIREAMRVSMLPNSNYSIPIYPYIRPVYKDTKDNYMSESDLVNTIGEAAALGAAGIISWGDMNVTDSESSCLDAQRHLKQVMNPYILNVSTAARLCSEALCGGRGRCVRKNWTDDVYLHLDPRRYSIVRPQPGAPLTVRGKLSHDDVDYFVRSFDCICYSEEPCHSLLMSNKVRETVIDPTIGGAHRPRPPLWLVTLYLILTYVVMRI